MDHNVRLLIRGHYQQQQLRIETGNRICAQLKADLGQQPGESEEDGLSAEAKDFLSALRDDYKRLTDGFKMFPSAKKFKGTPLISDYSVLCMVEQYVNQLECERKHLLHLAPVVKEHPLWQSFLGPIKGCGILMAGVIISEIDITKAPYMSSLWRYAGYDVVEQWVKVEERLVNDDKTTFPDADPLHMGRRVDGVEFVLDASGLRWNRPNGSHAIYQRRSLGGRSRKAEHLVLRAYTNKKGEEAERKSITFNPWLKTKLYVLAGVFLKMGGPYRSYYDEYKARIEMIPHWMEKSKGHRHNASMRYMIKRFLGDLYVSWRKIEGLPVALPYTDKLGEHPYLPTQSQELK